MRITEIRQLFKRSAASEDHAERNALRVTRSQHGFELRHRAQRAHHGDHDEERREHRLRHVREAHADAEVHLS